MTNIGQHYTENGIVSAPQSKLLRRPEPYAAKIAAESILAEPPSVPNLSPENILAQMSNCAKSLHTIEQAEQVRDVYLAQYGGRA